MRKYANIPIDQLMSDVAVDPVHVRELADSIKVSGPISPVLVREDNLTLIDGFHRVAAMKELGFTEVECILTPCDDETFWDLRIMSASLHKAVTFARAIDWVEECFRLSPWADKYKSAYSFFASARTRALPKEAHSWIEQKAQKWGLSTRTIEDWLYTKQNLAPDLLQKATRPDTIGAGPSLSHYREVALELPKRPRMQQQVIQKVEAENLTVQQTEAVARALRQAADEKEVQSILRQPVSRTEEQMVREAKVEKILAQPREITPLEKYQEAKHEDVLYKLDLLGIINNSKAMTSEKISALTPNQKADVYRTCEEAISEIRRVMAMIKPTIRAEYQLKEG